MVVKGNKLYFGVHSVFAVSFNSSFFAFLAQSLGLCVSGNVVRASVFQAFRLGYVSHRSALTEKAWGDAVQ